MPGVVVERTEIADASGGEITPLTHRHAGHEAPFAR